VRLFFTAAPSETVVVTAVLPWTAAEGAVAPFQPVSSTGAGTSPRSRSLGNRDESWSTRNRDTPLTPEQFTANLAAAKERHATADDLLRHDGVTLSRGGPCTPGFLRMHEPYWGPYGECTRGVTFVSGDK
jgi:hypothetical protein